MISIRRIIVLRPSGVCYPLSRQRMQIAMVVAMELLPHLLHSPILVPQNNTVTVLTSILPACINKIQRRANSSTTVHCAIGMTLQKKKSFDLMGRDGFISTSCALGDLHTSWLSYVLISEPRSTSSLEAIAIPEALKSYSGTRYDTPIKL